MAILANINGMKELQPFTPEWLRAEFERTGKTQADLWKALSARFPQVFKNDRSKVNKMVTSGIRKATQAEQPVIWQFFDRDLKDLPEALGLSPNPTPQPQQLIPKEALVGDRTFPVHAAAMGGEGFMIVTFNPVEWVKHPAVLEGVSGGYGLLIYGDSMSPSYRAGDVALVHPHLLPEANHEFIFYDSPPDGQVEAMIKTLVGWNDQKWRLRQYNPPKDFSESRVDWPIAHRVVGKYDRR